MTRMVTSLLAATLIGMGRASFGAEPAIEATPFPYKLDMMNVLHYTGTVYPSPQKVTYADRFIDLRDTVIVPGEDLKKADDIRVTMLKDRIEGLGGKVRVASEVPPTRSAVIYLNVKGKGAAAPEKAEGYAIRNFKENGSWLSFLLNDGDDAVAITGADRQGVLWAAVSLAQLTRKGENGPELRAVELDDWPDIACRGFLCGYWTRYAPELMLFSKLNAVVFQSVLAPREKTNWRDPISDDAKQMIKSYGKLFREFGFDNVYCSINPTRPSVKSGEKEAIAASDTGRIDCCSAADLAALVEKAGFAAKNGFGLYLAFDDSRFPLTAADKAKYGFARFADTDFANNLYRAVKANYPNFKMIFCPPFYYGPDSSAAYPENRDDYLFYLGEKLDSTIDVWWAGPRVKSGQITKDHVNWIRARLRRPPMLFHNGKNSPHPFMYSYVSDPYDCWRKWYYEGFYRDIRGYCQNSQTRGDAMALATLGGALWNLKAYDANNAVKTAVNMYFGPEGFALADDLRAKLGVFDVYQLTPSVAAARRVRELEKAILEIEAAYKRLYDYNPIATRWFSLMDGFVQRHKDFIGKLKNNRLLTRFADAALETKTIAAKETGYREGQDILLPAVDFAGGRGPANYAARCPKRLATWIYGAKTPNRQLSANFTCDPFPPSGDYQLILVAQDDDAEKACEIEIKTNDRVLFKGPSPFVRFGWSLQTYTIPADCLRRYNKLTIDNLEDTDRAYGPPFFMLNYAVLKKTAP